MICPDCRTAQQLSTVRIVRTTDPKAPRDVYFDEEGQEHNHNPNIVITEFVCSNGHRFAERSSWECWCGYKACSSEIVTETVATSEIAMPRQASPRRTPSVPAAIKEKRKKAPHGRRGD